MAFTPDTVRNPHPAHSTRRTRPRLLLDAPDAPATVHHMFVTTPRPGRCATCQQPWEAGTLIWRAGGGDRRCITCAPPLDPDDTRTTPVAPVIRLADRTRPQPQRAAAGRQPPTTASTTPTSPRRPPTTLQPPIQFAATPPRRPTIGADLHTIGQIHNYTTSNGRTVTGTLDTLAERDRAGHGHYLGARWDDDGTPLGELWVTDMAVWAIRTARADGTGTPTLTIGGANRTAEPRAALDAARRLRQVVATLASSGNLPGTVDVTPVVCLRAQRALLAPPVTVAGVACVTERRLAAILPTARDSGTAAAIAATLRQRLRAL